VTSTLETALAGLPAKSRVHELSKRIGISNKELLAALAARGLAITSASASVPIAVAQAVIEDILGAPAEPEEVGEVPAETPDFQPPSRPGDAPGHEGSAINPLFLPPAEAQAVDVSEADQSAADDRPTDPAPADDAAPIRSGSSRRRRGRSSGQRRQAAAIDGTDAETAGDTVDAPTADVPTADAPTADVEAAAGEAVTGTEQAEIAQTAAENAESDNADGAESDSDLSDSEDDSGARGRRRRRGRRGRGRVADGEDRADQAASEQVASEQGASDQDALDQVGGEPATDEPGDPAVDAAVALFTAPQNDTESDSDSDEGDDSDTEPGSEIGGVSSGNRRRRRRRRRSTGDEAPREDDPDNTVVHVREPRLSQASSAAAGPVSNEVQGVRGSTRLEAKRQRRRDSRDSSRRRPQILTEAEFLARRESVERVMAVRQRGGLAQVALLEDGILVEHFVSQTGSDSMIGSVFLGRVQNVLPSMEAAFVDIGKGRNAVIYAGEVNWDAAGLGGKARRIETALSSGDTILAQVSKDPVGHKGARLTTQISLPGRFVVYVPGGGATGISRKLPDTERKRLKSIMDRIVPDDAGVIIRTAAEGIAESELAADVERLKSQWEEITRRSAEKAAGPTQLYAEPGTLIKVVRDLFNSDITRLVVDGDDAFGPVQDYVTSVAPELADRLVRYEPSHPGGADVFGAYRIDEQIAKALERKVHLPSGGSLVIDRTEAMTVVDVNTGKYTGSGGNLEETVTKNNLEAAEEMVRQLRLRDIGGIIVIDFIDMVLESNRELVLRRLTEALGRDRTRHQVAEVTSLGLVQMTRKRMGTGLVEAFSEPCPHCGGRGIVLHDLPVAATAFEDGPGERRAGKTRRSRGNRDAERVEEIVVPRVVEPVGRRPDPRGPKPPSFGAGERSGLDGIEAAVSAGIAAAQAADDDGDGHQESAAAELVVDEPVVDGPVVDEPVGDESVTEPAAAVEPAVVEPAVAEPRRRRRAAGRPAGAPTAAAAVDIIVREAPVSSNGSELHADAQPEAHQDPAPPTEAVAVAAPPPRRRRAAVRPAGPAAGDQQAEALIVSVPAPQPAG
jgi:ribonuclease E